MKRKNPSFFFSAWMNWLQFLRNVITYTNYNFALGFWTESLSAVVVALAALSSVDGV